MAVYGVAGGLATKGTAFGGLVYISHACFGERYT